MRFPEFSGEYEITRIGKLTNKVGSGVTPKGGESVYTSEGHPFVRSQNVGNGQMFLDEIAYIDEDTHSKQIATEIKHGDVLLNITGASIGRCCVASDFVVGGNVNQHVCIVRPTQDVTSYYLCSLLLSDKGQKQIDSFQAGGNRQGLNFEQIKSFKFSIPKLSEQMKVSKLLTLVDERITTQIRIIEDLKQLRSAIRNRIFKKIQQEPEQIVQIKEILTYEQPTKYLVSNTEYVNDSSLIPVLTANKAFILGYTFEKQGVYDKGDCIILDDFTLDCKIVDFPFKVKSSAIKILRAKNRNMLRYAFEYLKYLDLETSEHKRHYIAEIEPIDISLPSQEKIEDIMHLFESLDMRIVNAEKTWSSYLSQKKFLLRELFV